MKRIVIGIIIIAICSFSFHKYQEIQERDSISRILQENKIRVSTTLNVMRGVGSVPKHELISSIDSHIASSSAAIITLKLTAGKKLPADADFAVKYLEQSLNVLRNAALVTKTLVNTRREKAVAKATIAKLENFIANPTNQDALYESNVARASIRENALQIAESELNVAVAALQLTMFDLYHMKKPDKSRISTSALLDKEDFRDIEIKI